MSAFYCYFLFGLKIWICFFSHVVCHVILYCFARDIEGPCTAMRVPNTTNSRISEMSIVGQPLFCCINFGGHLLIILLDILESFAVYQHI